MMNAAMGDDWGRSSGACGDEPEKTGQIAVAVLLALALGDSLEAWGSVDCELHPAVGEHPLTTRCASLVARSLSVLGEAWHSSD